MSSQLFRHSCGHYERVNVDASYRVVSLKVKRIEMTECAMCEAARTRMLNVTTGFGELWGTKEDCMRAEGIRRRTLAQVDACIEHALRRDRDAWEELRRRVLRFNDAAWWIEHKNDAIVMIAQEIDL
ncbi:hypothetical protein [Bifidobacterium biavatii]|uniref:Uncharacterized protein n=1 Tax=Bifidobacterium biavatii DSM 23969 TaxID=1437608 RepID=A0A086ZDA3_9BIFI|nr:hypothetical protein [Bifidobacterium biavatii]KFI44503.1 hypothetical protein BBIA_2411 [Bifidobacterium biavatii DSM 23969]